MRLSHKFGISSKFVFIRFFSDWMVCRFGVPYLRIILYSSKKFLYSFEKKELPLSGLMFGTPYTFNYSRRNVETVSWFVSSQIFVIGQRLFYLRLLIIKKRRV